MPALNKQGMRRKTKTPGSGVRTVTEKLKNPVGIQRSQRTGFSLTLLPNFRIALECMVLWRSKVSTYLLGRWKQRWSTTLDKDAHTNLTLSSAISGHWTTSQTKAADFNSWCCRKEKGAFCLGYSMVKEDSVYRSLPEREEGFGALAQTKISPPDVSFKHDPHFSAAQSESELLISALQQNTWDQGLDSSLSIREMNLAFLWTK